MRTNRRGKPQSRRRRRAHHDVPRAGSRPVAACRAARAAPASAAQLLPASGQVHRRGRARPAASDLYRELARAPPVAQPSPVGRAVSHRHPFLRTHQVSAAKTPHRRGTAADQRQPHRQFALQGGNDSRLLQCRLAHHRRGLARAGRPLSSRAPDAGRFRRPAHLHVHALRQTRFFLRSLGPRRRRLAAHRRAPPRKFRASAPLSSPRNAAALEIPIFARNTSVLSSPWKAWSIPTWANAWFPRSLLRYPWHCRARLRLVGALSEKSQENGCPPLRLVGGIDFG